MKLEVKVLSPHGVRYQTQEGAEGMLVPGTKVEIEAEAMMFHGVEDGTQTAKNYAEHVSEQAAAAQSEQAAGKPAEDDPDRTNPAAEELLLGSSVQPPVFTDIALPIEDGEPVHVSTLSDLSGHRPMQLGDLVAMAHAASGLTVKLWNELAEDVRESYLAKSLEALVAKIGPARTAKAANDAGDVEQNAKASEGAAVEQAQTAAPVSETKTCTDGTSATGTAPLPDQSPAQQAANTEATAGDTAGA